MTSSFSVPQARGHWLHVTPSAARQYKTKKLLGLTHIILKMDASEDTTAYIVIEKGMQVKQYIDAQHSLRVVELTL